VSGIVATYTDLLPGSSDRAMVISL